MNVSTNSAVPLRTWSLVELGVDIERLKNATSETPLAGDDLQGALDRLERVHDALLHFDLRSARDVYERDILPVVREVRYFQRQEGLTQLGDYADEVQRNAHQLLEAIERDALQRQAFLVRPTSGGLDPSAILLDPYALFGLPGRAFPPLPRACDYYLVEASRCFAVDFSFAATMLIATIVENLLQFYYELITGQRIKQDQSWMQLENDLEDRKWNCPRTVLRASRRVRKLRNKLAHGDIETGSEDVVEVFDAARRAVDLIIKDLIKQGRLQIVSPEVLKVG